MRINVQRTCGITAIVGAVLAATASTAPAAHFYPSALLGTPWSDTTVWAAATGAFAFKHPTSGATLGQCSASTLSGSVAGTGTRLDVSAASLSGCVIGGSSAFVVPVVSTAWRVVPAAGGGLVWPTAVQGVRLTLRCGSPVAPPATYGGDLATDAAGSVDWQNVAASPSRLVVAAGAGLVRTAGTGCPLLPTTMRITATMAPTSVGGATVSPTNDLWVGP